MEHAEDHVPELVPKEEERPTQKSADGRSFLLTAENATMARSKRRAHFERGRVHLAGLRRRNAQPFKPPAVSTTTVQSVKLHAVSTETAQPGRVPAVSTTALTTASVVMLETEATTAMPPSVATLKDKATNATPSFVAALKDEAMTATPSFVATLLIIK